MLRFSMGNAILNKLMNLLISLARDVVPPRASLWSTPKCALSHLEYSHVIALEESDSSKVT